MEMGQAFEDAFVKKPEVALKKEAFTKLEAAGGHLSETIKNEQEKDGIPVESRLKASLFLRKELAAEIGPDTLFDRLMEIAREKGLKVVFYGGGAAWSGDQWSGREVSDNPKWKPPSLLSLSVEVSGELISPEKMEEGKKAAALDFLVDAGMDICITLDPEPGEGFVSSMRADHMAKRAVYGELVRANEEDADKDEAKQKDKLLITKVDWSNSGIKEFQMALAAFEAIAVDLSFAGEMSEDFDALAYLANMADQSKIGELTVRDEMLEEKVFRSGYEAVEYLSNFGKLNMDWFIGGAPANHVELAAPFKLTQENPILKRINIAGITLMDNLVYSLRKLTPKRLPASQSHILTRIQEMARAKRFSDLEYVRRLWGKTGEVVSGLMGEDTRILTLADTSGSVVTSDKQFVGDDLRRMFGERVIMVETHDWKPLPRRAGEEIAKTENEAQFRFDRDYSPAQHGELKRAGVLPRLMGIIKEIRSGTFHRGRNLGERYVVVEPEATIYEQKKGTQIRLNKLPNLG